MLDVFAAPGQFWRGNIHDHSSNSDVTLTPEEVCAAYRKQGYDFICLSDHFLPQYNHPVTDTPPIVPTGSQRSWAPRSMSPKPPATSNGISSPSVCLRISPPPQQTRPAFPSPDAAPKPALLPPSPTRPGTTSSWKTRSLSKSPMGSRSTTTPAAFAPHAETARPCGTQCSRTDATSLGLRWMAVTSNPTLLKALAAGSWSRLRKTTRICCSVP